MGDQDKKTSYFTESYNERLKNISANNKFSTKFEIYKKNSKQQWIRDLINSNLK